jgi:mannose-1-phosphate guanylyltransferase
MSPTLIPIILAGGKGERFWPLSRRQRPKQFLSLDGSGVSLLQGTAERLLGIAEGWNQIWVVTASHLAAGVREQLPELPEANLWVEPEGRDTAPAVTWATLEAARRYGEEAVVGFFPADHWIDQLAEFEQTLKAAADLAIQEGAIVTLGIPPAYPATGYGYIEQGDFLGQFEGLGAYRVSRFTEKPDLATATAFLESGRFSWNGGIFVFQAGVALRELQQYVPEILNPLEELGVEAYPTLPKISIDYGLMEKTQQVAVLPVTFGWDDLGDWNALDRLLKQDSHPTPAPTADSTPDRSDSVADQVADSVADRVADNVELANHLGLDSHNCIFYASDPEELLVSIGLENMVVVRDGSVTLVVHKDRTQDIKAVLKQLQDHPKYQSLL